MALQIPTPQVLVTNTSGQQVDVTQWLSTISSLMGRQHELDRVEASTVTLKFDNRDGRFSPWNTNTYTWNLAGSGTTTISPLTINAPLTITGTWAGTTYSVFTGTIDLIQPVPIDELDDDVTIQATDQLKRMSLRRLLDGDIYPDLVTSDASNATASGVLTNTIQPAATSISVTPALTGSVGDVLAIQDGVHSEKVYIGSGWTSGTNPVPLISGTKYGHASGQVVNDLGSFGGLTVTSKGQPYGFYYRLNDEASNPAVANPVIYRAQDTWANGAGQVVGSVAFGQTGARVYDPDMACDMSNGTGAGAGCIATPGFQTTFAGLSGYYNRWTMEAWVLQPNTNDYLFCNYDTANYCAIGVQVVGAGQCKIVQRVLGVSSQTTTDLSTPTGTNVQDGKWHLVTLNKNGATLTLWVDGVQVGTGSGTTTNLADEGFFGGYVAGTQTLALPVYSCAGILDECVMVFDLGGFYSDASERYRKGTLLSNQKSSGQKITDALQIAGFTPNIANGTTTIDGTGMSGSSTTLTVSSQLTAPGMVKVPGSGGSLIFNYTGKTGTTLTGCTLQQGTSSWTIANGSTVTQLPLVNSGQDIDLGYVQCIGDTTQTTQEACLDQILNVVQTEEGFFFQDQGGVLRFYNRFYCQETAARQIGGAAVVISDNASGATARYKYASPEILIDDLDLWNRAEITDLSGNVTEIGNSASIAAYGARTVPKSSVYTATTIDTLALGMMLLYKFATPMARVQKIQLSSTAQGNVSTQIPTMLGLNLWDQVTFSRAGIGSSRYTMQMVVESISHTFNSDPGEWITDLVLSPYEMVMGSSTPNSGSVFQLGSSTFTGTTTTTINGTGMTGASGTLTVASTVTLPAAGQVSVPGSGGSLIFNYTGKTGTTLTGCYLLFGTSSWTITNGATVTSNSITTSSQDVFGG